jgi:hypothetical protein
MALIPLKARTGIVALIFAGAVAPFASVTPAKAVTVTYDENGGFSCDVSGPCLFTGIIDNQPDPRGRVPPTKPDGSAQNVLQFELNTTDFRFPNAFTMAILDKTTGALSDALTFLDPNQGDPNRGRPTRMIFYSFDSLGEKADVRNVPPGFCPPLRGVRPGFSRNAYF